MDTSQIHINQLQYNTIFINYDIKIINTRFILQPFVII